MPTLKRHRTYCKTCNNFTIHNLNYICEACGTEFTSYFPNEVDDNLIQQQRARYNAKKKIEFGGIYGAFMQGVGIESLMALDSISQEIVECDAGEIEIREKRRQKREEIQRKAQEILDDYNTNYKKLNRNDKCSCGSGKKFKQCHLVYFNQYLKL